jgi:1-acyl-sn-glycerol-3-phosphate acyltransferase
VIGYVRAVSRLTALTTLTLSLLALYSASFWRGANARRRIVRTWHVAAARIVGIHIRAHGTIAAPGALIASNHVSYIDVIALGALTEATFVAKASVAHWPVIGFLARLVNTLFVDRSSTHCLGQIKAIAAALNDHQSVVLFPEGTSTTGRMVLPFKSTLFAAAQSAGVEAMPGTPHPVTVQPVTIAYVKSIHGWDLPIDERRIHPWIGEDELVPHLWAMLKHPGVVADVLFHQPVAADTFASRKELAEHCRAASAHGLVVARRRTALPVAANADDWLESPLFGLLG